MSAVYSLSRGMKWQDLSNLITVTFIQNDSGASSV